MNIVTLEHLPTLVLHSICAIIWNDSSNDLLAFSTASKACREAAAPFVFKSRIIRVSNRKQLSEDVQSLTEAFSGAGCSKFLRFLTVEGVMPLLEKDVGQGFEEDELAGLERLDTEIVEDNPFGLFSATLRSFSDPAEDNKKEVIQAWSPLARLISSLRFLTDLTFACANQFPPNLLEVLHKYNPTCRLHLPRFRFRSLNNKYMDPDELAIMTSPCLYSLRVRFVEIDSNGRDDHNEEAIRYAAALAPNLHHLTVADSMVLDTLGRDFFATGQTGWQGLLSSADSSRKASIRSLSLCCNQYFADQSLSEWRNRTDFSKLEVLVLADVAHVAPLANAAVRHEFVSLRELSINLVQIRRDEHFESQAELFFENLQPLTVLRLFGFITNSLVAVIAAKHGCALRNLRIRPEEPSNCVRIFGGMIMHPSDILDIAEKCPHLQGLHLPIRRCKSGTRETDCYEALGNFPSLTSVTLTLECSKSRGPDIGSTNLVPSYQHVGFIGGDEAIRSVHMQNALINCAVDGSLARSIWEIISTNKARKYRLEELHIKTSIHSNAYRNLRSDELDYRLSHIAGSYLLKRRSNSCGSDDVEIIDRAIKHRKDLFEAVQLHRRDTPEGIQDIKQVRAAFEKVWPRKKGRANWRKNWSSRPLQRKG